MNQHSRVPLDRVRLIAADDPDIWPDEAEGINLARDLLDLEEQLEALRASVEIVQSERDEAVGKLRSLGLDVVDAMCDQSSTCRATEHKPWCFGYQPAYGIGGNLPGAESTPAIIPAEASERGRNPAVDPRDAIKPESGKPRSETSASSPAKERP